MFKDPHEKYPYSIAWKILADKNANIHWEELKENRLGNYLKHLLKTKVNIPQTDRHTKNSIN